MSYTPSVAGGGGLVLVDAQEVVGAAASAFVFPGLNGDVDGNYELYWWMEGRVATGVNIVLLPNALTSNAASTWTVTNGVPANPDAFHETTRLVATSGMQRDQGWGHGKLEGKTGAFRGWTSVAGEGDGLAAASSNRWRSQGMWRTSVTNITSLNLTVTTAPLAAFAGWGVGSRCQLWKRPY